MKGYKKGFTLIELMVMIVILSIIGTISFIKYSDYTKTGHDFKRVSDLAQIKMQLDVYSKKHSGLYPEVTDLSKITILSGAEPKATQGRFSSDIAGNIGITKHLVDPKLGIDYTYSVSADKSTYQIATTLFDNDVVSSASSENGMAYVLGNYIPSATAGTLPALPGLIYAVLGISNFDINVPGNVAKVVLNGQATNLMYDISGNVLGGGTSLEDVINSADITIKTN